jgi:hypothetical protein
VSSLPRIIILTTFATLLLAGCGAQATTNNSAVKSAASSAATKAPQDNLAVKQLGAEMYVTSQNYLTHMQSGDAPRAASDRESLLGKCDTARLVVPKGSQAQEAMAIRGMCETLGVTVP